MRLTYSEHADMLSTCLGRFRSGTPDGVYRTVKARAAQSGQTLSDYLLAEIERISALPTREEMLARLHARDRVTLKTSAAAIRKERETV